MSTARPVSAQELGTAYVRQIFKHLESGDGKGFFDHVAGDVVYSQCHMYVGDTTPESRQNWIAGLDRLAALSPAIVVVFNYDAASGKFTADPRSLADCGNSCHVAVKAKDYIFHPYEKR